MDNQVGIIQSTEENGGVLHLEDQAVTTMTKESVEEDDIEPVEEYVEEKDSSVLSRLVDKIDIERIDITDLIVVTALSVALLYSIYMKMMELAMSIGSGLLGYIGGVSKKEDQPTKVHRTDTTTTTTTTTPAPDRTAPACKPDERPGR